LTLEEGDRLIGVDITDGTREILLGTRMGIVIRFREEDVRPVGRTARGVRGITLDEGNEVIGMVTITSETQSSILTVTERGYGKRTQVEEYRLQSRAGKGVISVKVTEKNGPAISFHQVWESDEIMLMSAEGMILRTRMGDIREIGRNAQGVRLIDLPSEDRVVGVAKLAETDESDPSGPDNANGDLPDGNGDLPVEPDTPTD
jgi:DNA gyrase subunit A